MQSYLEDAWASDLGPRERAVQSNRVSGSEFNQDRIWHGVTHLRYTPGVCATHS